MHPADMLGSASLPGVTPSNNPLSKLDYKQSLWIVASSWKYCTKGSVFRL